MFLLFNKTSMFENKCYCCSKAYVKSNVKLNLLKLPHATFENKPFHVYITPLARKK